MFDHRHYDDALSREPRERLHDDFTHTDITPAL